jgi:hypothetical protein
MCKFKVLCICFILSLSVSCIIDADAETTVFRVMDGVDNPQLKAAIERNMNTMFAAFNKAASEEKSKLNLPDKGFSKTVQKELNEMWKSSSFVVSKPVIKDHCLTTPTGFQIRNIPVTMLSADEKENEQEIVVNFLKDGTVDDVEIALDAQCYKAIIEDNQSVTDLARRQIIINFVEAFRTAYNRKDMAYLRQIYSDNALIITGHIVKTQPIPDSSTQLLSSAKIVYQKQTKQQYLQNLEMVFKTAKYLNVLFSDVDVVQHPKYDDIYGVTLKQNWHTNRYSDEGYLFLMIDFKNEQNPLIQVRTWQPYKFEGHVLPASEVFHLGSFNIAR